MDRRAYIGYRDEDRLAIVENLVRSKYERYAQEVVVLLKSFTEGSPTSGVDRMG